VNGSCIEPPETGKAVISILNATVFKQDEDSDSDPYVKVYLDQKYLMKTRVIENSNNPIWMTSFVTPVMTSDAQLGFIVFDKDPGGEELLLTVQTSVSMILALGQNATAVCGPQGSPKGQLCYLIKWYPLNLDI
jgi:Ca2+-dependent lipid-binding protein